MNGPRSGIYCGQYPGDQGEQFVSKYGGARRDSVTGVQFSGVICGTAEQWAGDLVSTRPADHHGDCCTTESDGMWAELVESADHDPLYGWWRLVCDPVTKKLVRGGPSDYHSIDTDPAVDLSGRIGLPVPGTIARVYEGCESQPWVFTTPNQSYFVQLTEDHPTQILEGGRKAYNAFLCVPTHGSGLDPSTTGVTAVAVSVLAYDVSGREETPSLGPWPAVWLGVFGGKVLFGWRSPEPPPDPPPPFDCAECEGNVTYVDYFDFSTLLQVGGVVYNLYNLTDGSLTLVKWIDNGVFAGWFDLCTCLPVPYWCCESSCIQALTNPGGCTGPYDTADACTAVCEASPLWWCTTSGCVEAEEPPFGTVSGPYSSSEECLASCYFWWCTSGDGCVYANSPPGGVMSGPYELEADCHAVCDPPLYWCTVDGCVESVSAPPSYVTGPYASTLECENQCVPSPCCPDNPLPFTLVFEVVGGVCPDTYFASYNPAPGIEGWAVELCPVAGPQAVLRCVDGNWIYNDGAGSGDVSPDSFDCGARTFGFTVTTGTLAPYSVSIHA